MTGVCLECGEKLFGRIDKKYCGDHCRSAYHNRQNRDSNQIVKNVNRILTSNRRILQKFQSKKVRRVSKEALLHDGFRFGYFTFERINRTGRVFKFCYDQGYSETDHKWLMITSLKETSDDN